MKNEKKNLVLITTSICDKNIFEDYIIRMKNGYSFKVCENGNPEVREYENYIHLFYDEQLRNNNLSKQKWFDELKMLEGETDLIISTIGYVNPVKELYESLKDKDNFSFPNVVFLENPEEYKGLENSIGNVIMPFNKIDKNTRFGNFNLIRTGCEISKNVKVKDNCFIGPNCGIGNIIIINSETVVNKGVILINNSELPRNCFSSYAPYSISDENRLIYIPGKYHFEKYIKYVEKYFPNLANNIKNRELEYYEDNKFPER